MLLIVAALYGAVAAIIFQRLTDAKRLRATTNQLLARIMEFHLFVDEPTLVWKAQWGALRANLSLLRQLALPCLVMAGLFAVFYTTLERHVGHGPLQQGESTVLTSRIDQFPQVSGLVAETPGVRVVRTGEVIWRVHPEAEFNGALPPGFAVQYPVNGHWTLWFFGVSSVSALIVSKTI